MGKIRQPGRVWLSPGDRRWSILLLLVPTVTLALMAAIPGPAGAEARGPGILIGFEPDAGKASRSAVLEAIDGEVARSFRLVPGLRLVEIPETLPPAEAIGEVTGMPGVGFVGRDSVMKIDRSANDPQSSQLWGITAIRAPSAWDVTTGSAGVTVAVIDTGMDLDHPDLAENLWTNPDEIPGNGTDDDGNGFVDDVHGWDFVNRDANPDDDQGHGTHTAGTVGAVGDNGIGVTGVAWDVSLVPLKICSATGSCLVSDSIAALDYAVREGIPISNNSYGYGGSCPTAFGAAIQAAGEAGHLLVASAGNEGRDLGESPKYPAACPQQNVISVAWLADERTLASKSNYGKPEVDIAAPGSQILSTTPGGNYGSKSGTSMAGPHVAGTAALLKSAEPDWGFREIKDRIMVSSHEVCGLEVLSGGTLDAGAALTGDTPTERTCPDSPVITTGPMGLTNSDLATFTFTGVAGAAYECRLDSGPWQACSSPMAYTGVANGSRLFRVTQRVGSGPTSAPSSWTWTVDTNAPAAPTVSAAPASPSTLKSATFTFSGESGASFLCQLDSGPLAACTSPLSLTGLIDGQRSLTVFQTDRAGNRSQGTTRTWTIATAAPEPPPPPTIGEAPSQLTSSRSASITFSKATGTTPRCRLDRNGAAGQWADCTSPVSLTGLDDGSYRLAIVLRNTAGGESTPAEVIWTVDGTAPAPPRVEAGPETFTGSSVEIAFSGEPGASFECRLDRPEGEGISSPCLSPFAPTGLAEGRHGIVIRQRDAAGNLSPGSTVVWTVDTTPPAPPSVEGGPNGVTNSRTAEFTFAGEQGSTAECLLEQDGGSGGWTTCPAGGRWVELEDGRKNLRVRLRDQAGNPSTEATREWDVDTLAPDEPMLSSGPEPVTRSRSASFSFSTESGAIASCRLDGGPWIACEGSFTTEGLEDGGHLLKVRQTDRAGNDSPEATRAWLVDNVAPPAPSISGGPFGWTRQTIARFTFEGEEGARAECRTGRGSWAPCPETIRFGPLEDGSRSASFRQVDRAGNVSGVVERSWAVDATAPEIGAAGRTIDRRGRAVLSVRAVDGGSGLAGLEVSFSSLRPSERPDRRVEWKGGRKVPIVSSMVPFWVRVADGAGNRSGWVRLKTR